MIDRFAVWLELHNPRDLPAFVAAMLSAHGRYDHLPRLIAADWLDEMGDELATYIRMARACYENPDDSAQRRQWSDMHYRILDELEAQGVRISDTSATVWYQPRPPHASRGDLPDQRSTPPPGLSTFQMRPNGVYQMTRRREFKPANLEKLPRPVLVGFLTVLCYRMVWNSPQRPDEVQDLQNIWAELGRYVVELRPYNGRIPPVRLERVKHALDNMLVLVRNGKNSSELVRVVNSFLDRIEAQLTQYNALNDEWRRYLADVRNAVK